MKNNRKKVSENLDSAPRRVEHSRDLAVQGKKPPGLQICEKCNAVFHKKRWQWNAELLQQHKNEKEIMTTCPACKVTRPEDAEGVVSLKGFVSESQREEMLRLMKHVGERATKRDPLDRIYKSIVKDKEVLVYTTENQLAISIGKQVKKAFHGQLKIDMSQEGDIVRVYWEGWMG
ncbi:BCAM0308 family protein [Patescibacteria group bacterium]